MLGAKLVISSGQGPGPGEACRYGKDQLGADDGSRSVQAQTPAQAQAQDSSQLLETETTAPPMGEAQPRAGQPGVVRSRLLATVAMWVNRWHMRKVIDLMLRNFTGNDMFKAMQLFTHWLG